MAVVPVARRADARRLHQLESHTGTPLPVARWRSMATDPQSVHDILDCLDDAGDDGGEVSVGDVSKTIGSRSFGPFLLVPALVGISPVGVIPGAPSFMAILIVCVAAQFAFGKDSLWLPSVMKERAVPRERLDQAIDWMRPVADRLDRWFGNRLQILTRGPAMRIAAAICLLVAFAVPPLELLPFAAAGPFAIICLFGLAITVRDGLLFLGASILTVAGAIAGSVYFLSGDVSLPF